MSDWQVVFEVRVVRQISGWHERDQIQLDAVFTILRQDGPAGLDWDPRDRTGRPTWDDLSEAYRAVHWKASEERFYRVTLEVRPGRTIIVRGAELGVYRRRPLGR